MKNDYQAPALILDEKLRARIVKAAHKHDSGNINKLLQWMTGPARLSSKKPIDIHTHLIKWSAKDEQIQRRILRIWFESQPGGLREHVKEALLTAGIAVKPVDFGQPLPAGNVANSSNIPAGIRRNGEPVEHCILMALLLGWSPSVGVKNSELPSDLSANTVAPQAAMLLSDTGEPPQEVVALKIISEPVATTTQVQDEESTAIELTSRIESLIARTVEAANVAVELVNKLRAGLLAELPLFDTSEIVTEYERVSQALQTRAQLFALPTPTDGAPLSEWRELAQALQTAVDVAAAAHSLREQAQGVLKKVTQIRHREEPVFEPLLAVYQQAEALGEALDNVVAQSLSDGTHLLAQFAQLVEAFEVWRQEGKTTAGLMQAGKPLLNLADGMSIYTAWVMGQLQIVAAESSGSTEKLLQTSAKLAITSDSVFTAPSISHEQSALTEVATPSAPIQEAIILEKKSVALAAISPPVVVEEELKPAEIIVPPAAEVVIKQITASEEVLPYVANSAPASQPVADLPPKPSMSSAFWNLLDNDGGAWLYQLARSQQALAADAKQVPVLPAWLLRASILGPEVRSDYGPIATLLTYDAVAFEEEGIVASPEEAPDTRVLLAWAGALRPTLLSPATDLRDWLSTGGINNLPIFSSLGYRLRGRTSPFPFSEEQLNRVQAQDNWTIQTEQFQQQLEQWEVEQRQPALFHRMRDHPMTRLWQALLGDRQLPTQMLDILRRLTDPRPSDKNELQEQLKKLNTWDRWIWSEMTRLGFPHDDVETVRHNTIAPRWLGSKLAELMALADRYQELEQLRPANFHAEWAKEDQELLRYLQEDTPKAHEELALALAAEPNLPRRVALAQCQKALEGLLAWVHQPTAPETIVEPRHLLSWPWLLTPNAPTLNQHWEPQVDMPTDQELLLATMVAPPSALAVYQQQTASSEPNYQLAARLLSAAQTLPIGHISAFNELAEMAELLVAKRPDAVARQQHWLRKSIQQVEQAIEQARRYGYAETDWAEVSIEELNALKSIADTLSDEAEDDVYNFQMHHGRLARLRNELAEHRQQEATRRRDIFNQTVETDNLRLTAADQSLLEQALHNGWFSLTDDYLSQLKRGQRLRQPAPARHPDLLTLKSELLVLEQLSTQVEAHEMQERIRTGCVLDTEAVQPSGFDNDRQEAAQAYASWHQLRVEQPFRSQHQQQLSEILEFIGFATPILSPLAPLNGGHRYDRSLDFQITTLRERRQCPVSRYGSDARGQYRLLLLPTLPPPAELVSLVESNSRLGTGRPVIVLTLEPVSWDRREEMGVYCRRELGEFLVFDELLLLHLASHGIGQSRLPLFFQHTLPFSHLNPFVTSGSIPPELFFGRVEELRRLGSRNHDSAQILYGGRQLGKTVLLRQLERDYHCPDEQRYVLFIDIYQIGREKTVAFLSNLLIRNLQEAQLPDLPTLWAKERSLDKLLDDIKTWVLANSSRCLTLLLDEADRLLEEDAEQNFAVISRFREVMEATGQRLKIVLSGLHNVQHSFRLPNQPLIQMNKAIGIGPLSAKEGVELIRQPLESLGFYFGQQAVDGTYQPAEYLVDQIGVETNYYPGLIQEFCSRLLAVLYTQQRDEPDCQLLTFITEEAVQQASRLAEPEIKHRFMLTLDLNPRFRLLTYLVAGLTQHVSALNEPAEPTVAQVHELAKLYYPVGFERTQHQEHYVESLLTELVGLSILEQVKKNGEATRYRLRTANVRALLGSPSDINAEIDIFLKDPPPPEDYSINVARSSYQMPTQPKRSLRSPLTVRDLLELEEGIKVSVIYGTVAAGLGQLGEFFEHATRDYKLHRVSCSAQWQPIADKLAELRAQTRKAKKQVLLVEDCYSGRIVQEALTALAHWPDKASVVLIVFEMGPATLWRFLHAEVTLQQLQQEGANLLPLVPWNRNTVKDWLTDTPASRSWEQVQRVTGGWHRLLLDFFHLEQPTAESSPKKQPVANTEQHLTQIAGALRSNYYATLWGLHEAPDFFRRLAQEWPDQFRFEDLELAALDTSDAPPTEHFNSWLDWASMLSLVHFRSEGQYEFDPVVVQALRAHA